MHSGAKRSIIWLTRVLRWAIVQACFSTAIKLRLQFLWGSWHNYKLSLELRNQAKKEYYSVLDQSDGLKPFSKRKELAQAPAAIAKKYKIDLSLVYRVLVQYAATGNILFSGDKDFIPSPYKTSLRSGKNSLRPRKAIVRSTEQEPSLGAVPAVNAESSAVPNRVTPSRGSPYGALSDDFGERFLPEPSGGEDGKSSDYYRTEIEESDSPAKSWKPKMGQAKNSLCWLTPAGVAIRLSTAKFLSGFMTWEEMVSINQKAMRDAGEDVFADLGMITRTDLYEDERKLWAGICHKRVLSVYKDKEQVSHFMVKQTVREAMDKDYQQYGIIDRLNSTKGTYQAKEEELLDEYLPSYLL